MIILRFGVYARERLVRTPVNDPLHFHDKGCRSVRAASSLNPSLMRVDRVAHIDQGLAHTYTNMKFPHMHCCARYEARAAQSRLRLVDEESARRAGD